MEKNNPKKAWEEKFASQKIFSKITAHKNISSLFSLYFLQTIKSTYYILKKAIGTEYFQENIFYF